MQGLGLLFMAKGARCEGFMTGRIKNEGEAQEIEEHQRIGFQAWALSLTLPILFENLRAQIKRGGNLLHKFAGSRKEKVEK